MNTLQMYLAQCILTVNDLIRNADAEEALFIKNFHKL